MEDLKSKQKSKNIINTSENNLLIYLKKEVLKMEHRDNKKYILKGKILAALEKATEKELESIHAFVSSYLDVILPS